MTSGYLVKLAIICGNQSEPLNPVYGLVHPFQHYYKFAIPEE